jgi:uncharacterized damage-inducible protein DinB
MLQNSIRHQFSMLTDLLENLNNDQYIYKSEMIGGFTIGQHVRHIIELFQALNNGYTMAAVDYEKRVRDMRIECSREVAIAALYHLQCDLQRPDKEMQLSIDGPDNAKQTIHTFYERELAYNIEHAIHHMSLIRVALREQKLNITPEHFGFAYSTIRKLEKQCAQ